MKTSSFAHVLTGRRSAWLMLLGYILAVMALTSVLSGAGTAARGQNLPPGSESERVAQALAQFPDADSATVLVVASRTDGAVLDQAQTGAVRKLGAELGGGRPMVIPSEDGKALIALAPLRASQDDTLARDAVKQLRERLAKETPDGLKLEVTGGPAFGGDIADSFSGADLTLLLVTVGIVAALLLVTYRSPILWLVPLLVVALADQAAGKLANWLSVETGWHAEVGVVSVLVFGAGTNYALLMISRYREELTRHEDHREALRAAWLGTRGAIIASNATVVVGLLTLMLAVLPDTRGLGLSSAAGLLLALLGVLIGLPAALAVVGRKIFWPFIPRPGQETRTGRVWGGVASWVVGRPLRALAMGLLLLGVMGAGLLPARVGLDQADQFRVKAESINGLRTVAEHFPAGFTAPNTVLVSKSALPAAKEAISATPGVESVQPTGEHAGMVRLQVIGEDAPGTEGALQTVRDLRTTLAGVPGADALVGGPVAQDLDQREAQNHDFWLAAPLVLVISLLVLVLLTRALLGPVLLLTVNVASAAAAIGAGSVVSRWLMGSPALAIQVPLFAFIFLVALGIDYTIFLVERAKHETVQHGTRAGMVEAVRHTGAVITSAGIVLAAVFAALGVLPLVVMGQLGIIVGLGVLVDTLVVRTVIVPALFGLLGDKIWWPRRVPQPASAD